MKRILIYVLFAMLSFSAKSQAVITHTVNVSWTDNLSQSRYKSINSENHKLTGKLTANTPFILGLSRVYKEQYDELKTLNRLFELRAKGSIARFANGTTFSNNVYDSMGYIHTKYPVLNLNPGDTFRNLIIRRRYSTKLNREKKRIENYVNPDNPIPEGERIYLILSTIENVLNITLHNEEY